ncbi:MAG: SDR family NAD(P)-dependent oxidoreductase, partial [SAR202 cluster bacterium]|nr:SDR family NAD(P)-dependent oxidoreductase [SAR202 cluster bacterium]
MGNRMEGRVVIVTGSGRGIGREVAHWMAADGASVVVNDLGGAVDGEGTSDSPAEQTAQEIRDKGGSAVANFDSVADYESAGKIVQTAIDNFGRLDAVCHVAGILRDRMIFNMTE